MEVTKTEVIYLQFNLWICSNTKDPQVQNSSIIYSFKINFKNLVHYISTSQSKLANDGWVILAACPLKLKSIWMELKWTWICWQYPGSIFIPSWNFNKLAFASLSSCLSRIKVGVFKDRLFYILNGFSVWFFTNQVNPTPSKGIPRSVIDLGNFELNGS